MLLTERIGADLQKNIVKERLKAGGQVYGTSVASCLDPEVPIVLAAAGLDFFFIDTEHSAAGYAQIQPLCRTARGAGIIPLVRVTQNDYALIARALDVGAMGIIVPRVHLPSDARAAIEAMKFPPLGARGYGLGSIVTDCKICSAQEEVNSANHETLAVLMIESRQGLESVEQIATIPGIDVLFVGPYDLSLSLGIIEQFNHPIFTRALDRIFEAAARAGVAVGLQFGDFGLLTQAREKGARFLMYSSDFAVLLTGYRDAISRLKG